MSVAQVVLNFMFMGVWHLTFRKWWYVWSISQELFC